MQAQPRTKYIYSNCGTNWLANALTNVFRQDLRSLTQSRLFSPLGLTSNDIRWRTPARYFPDPVYGIPATEFNGGMLANADAMARFGYLFLNGGNWNGRQVVSSSFVSIGRASLFLTHPNLDDETVWAAVVEQRQRLPRGGAARRLLVHGQEQQPTLVVPSLDLVAVRIGTDGWSNHGGNHASSSSRSVMR